MVRNPVGRSVVISETAPRARLTIPCTTPEGQNLTPNSWYFYGPWGRFRYNVVFPCECESSCEHVFPCERASSNRSTGAWPPPGWPLSGLADLCPACLASIRPGWPLPWLSGWPLSGLSDLCPACLPSIRPLSGLSGLCSTDCLLFILHESVYVDVYIREDAVFEEYWPLRALPSLYWFLVSRIKHAPSWHYGGKAWGKDWSLTMHDETGTDPGYWHTCGMGVGGRRGDTWESRGDMGSQGESGRHGGVKGSRGDIRGAD